MHLHVHTDVRTEEIPFYLAALVRSRANSAGGGGTHPVGVFRAGHTDVPLLGLGASLENQISATADHRALPYPSLGSCCCLRFQI